MKTIMQFFVGSCLLFISSFANAQAVEISQEALLEKGSLMAIAPTLLDEVCDKTLTYTVVRVHEGKTVGSMEGEAKFSEELKQFLGQGKAGDAYQFSDLRTKCNGAWKDVKSESVVVKIKA